ncbi:MAG: VapC toxin family PIN domain ribonuclease [Gammaproteobacteria bacterium]
MAILLEQGLVAIHPFVVGEIACGSVARRSSTLGLLADLPAVVVAEPDEVLDYIERRALHGKGVGYVDVHLLASVSLTTGVLLWTRDKRLRSIAENAGLAWQDSGVQ